MLGGGLSIRGGGVRFTDWLGRALAAVEPHGAHHRQGRCDIHVQPQAEEVDRGIDAQRLLEDPVGGVAEYVQGDQPRRLDLAVMPEPDQYPGPGEIEDQLVEEGGLEGAVVQVLSRDAPRYAVLVRDLQAP